MTWIPLLETQRDLLDVPRGSARFQQYLKTMVDTAGELRLPLAAFNPMSKPHIASLLDGLLAMDAEAIGSSAATEAADTLGGVEASLGLVVADDAQGGWTNRWLFDAQHLFESRYTQRRGLISVLLWSSEPANPERIRAEVAAAVFRHAYIAHHGQARTLEQRIRQESLAASFAGRTEPPLPAAEQAILLHHLYTEHYPTIIACLYGDDAALACGYDALGLPPHAGLRFGLHHSSAAELRETLQTLRRGR